MAEADPVAELDALLAEVWDAGYRAGSSWNDGLGEYVPPTANPYGRTSIDY